MIEKLPYSIDVESMRKDLDKIKNIPITFQGKEYGYNNFGGWSVLSRTGRCEDGWEVGIDKCENKWYKYFLAKYLEISHPFEHVNPTPACIGEIKKIISVLDEQGFYPRRARITMIKAQTCSITHRDYPWSSDNLDDGYMCRVHVPIITNEKCTHWAERKEYHMPADGSVYILPVNNQHQIRNNSNIDRYHLIVDVYDTRGISKTMKFNDTIQKLETSAQDYRKEIDKTTVTVFHQLLFEFGKLRYKFASKL